LKYEPDNPTLVPTMLDLVDGLSLLEQFSFLSVLEVRLKDTGRLFGGLSTAGVTLLNKRKEPSLFIKVYRITIGKNHKNEQARTLGHELGHILCEDILGIKEPRFHLLPSDRFAEFTPEESARHAKAWNRWHRKIEFTCDNFSDAWIVNKKLRVEIFCFFKELDEKQKVKTGRDIIQVPDEIFSELFPL